MLLTNLELKNINHFCKPTKTYTLQSCNMQTTAYKQRHVIKVDDTILETIATPVNAPVALDQTTVNAPATLDQATVNAPIVHETPGVVSDNNTVDNTSYSFEEREAFYEKLRATLKTDSDELDAHFPCLEPSTQKLNAAYIALTSTVYATLDKFGKTPELSAELNKKFEDDIHKFDNFIKTLKSNRWFKYLTFAAGTMTIIAFLFKMMPFNTLPNVFNTASAVLSAIPKPNVTAADNLTTAKEIIKDSPVAEIVSSSTIVLGVCVTVVAAGLIITNIRALNIVGKMYKAYHRV